MIQRNLFSLGFSMFSLLEVSREFPSGILNVPSKPCISLQMELVSRQHLAASRRVGWQTDKQLLMKVLRLSCSTIKACFSE
jgi:hypothetical protein